MFVFSNLATSIDGKIATRSREHFPLGTPYDRHMMQTLRREADAIVIGASTLRAYRKPLSVRAKGKLAARQPINAVVSSKLEGLSPSWPFFNQPGIRRILFVSSQAPAARVRQFSQVAEVHRLRAGAIAPQIIRALGKLGVKRLLVEGGGGLMADFIAPNLIDEVHLTLTPRILGGAEAPTLVDGAGLSPDEVVNYLLKSCKRRGDELYLVYARKAKRGR